MQLMYTPRLAVIRIAIIALSNVCCVDDPDPDELTGSPERLQQQGRHVLSDVRGGNNYRTPHSRLVRLLATCTVACVQVLLRGLQEPVLVVPVVLLLTRPHPLAHLRSPAECHLPPATCAPTPSQTILDHPPSATFHQIKQHGQGRRCASNSARSSHCTVLARCWRLALVLLCPLPALLRAQPATNTARQHQSRRRHDSSAIHANRSTSQSRKPASQVWLS